MLIPSIDLMDGKIVQLVQGKRKALEFDDVEEWITRFSSQPLIQLIDLNAAIGTGNNRGLVRELAKRLPCQVGGGIRSIPAAKEMLDTGAVRVILGSALIRDDRLDPAFAKEIAEAVGPDKLVFAIDSRQDRVAIRGWRELTTITPLEMITALERFCGAFLYTHIDTEGLMQGIPVETVRRLRNSTTRQLIVAGGIATSEQVDRLGAMKIDAVVGMAIYTGKVKLSNPSRALRPHPSGS